MILVASSEAQAAYSHSIPKAEELPGGYFSLHI